VAESGKAIADALRVADLVRDGKTLAKQTSGLLGCPLAEDDAAERYATLAPSV
jgi:hypothetical protein